MNQNPPPTHDFPILPPTHPPPLNLTRPPSTSWGDMNTQIERESTTSSQPSSVPILRKIQMENTVSTLANGSSAQNPTQNHLIDIQSSPTQTLSWVLNEFLHQQAKTFQTRYSEAETILGIFNQLLDNLTDPQMRQLAEFIAVETRDKILLILWGNPTNQQQSYTAQSKVILQPMKSTVTGFA